MEFMLASGLIMLGLALVTAFVHFSRSRDRVMAYHHIETPRINEMTHGGSGGGGGG